MENCQFSIFVEFTLIVLLIFFYLNSCGHIISIWFVRHLNILNQIFTSKSLKLFDLTCAFSFLLLNFKTL
jgi:hypothetical protein